MNVNGEPREIVMVECDANANYVLPAVVLTLLHRDSSKEK